MPKAIQYFEYILKESKFVTQEALHATDTATCLWTSMNGKNYSPIENIRITKVMRLR